MSDAVPLEKKKVGPRRGLKQLAEAPQQGVAGAQMTRTMQR